MRDRDNKEGKEETWLKEHNSVNPQSLFMLLGNDGNVFREQEMEPIFVKRNSVYYTAQHQNEILGMLCDLKKVCENSTDEKQSFVLCRKDKWRFHKIIYVDYFVLLALHVSLYLQEFVFML